MVANVGKGQGDWGQRSRCVVAEHFASDYNPHDSRHRVVIGFNSAIDGEAVKAHVCDVAMLYAVRVPRSIVDWATFV